MKLAFLRDLTPLRDAITRLDQSVRLLSEITGQTLDRLKAIEEKVAQGEAHATAPKRRGRPPKAASSD